MAEPSLTAARLRELFHYDPETGVFTRIVKTSPFTRIGEPAGSTGHVSGYVHLKVDRRMYKAHRLAVLYMTGQWPTACVDHIDMVRSNNRWGNLRQATAAENNRHVHARSNNKSGFKGVCWHKPSQRYMAQTSLNGVHHYLGVYATPEEASAAYQQFAAKHFGEFNGNA